MSQATYSPAVFRVGSMDEAKRIILTTEGELTTEQRWRTETPYLLHLIDQNFRIDSDSVVLDYGCGIGRMSKALIEKYGCRVIGADISASMRALAASYVSSDRFLACAPEMLELMNVEFDAALTIWVLQHCYQVEDDIARIKNSLREGGDLFVVNDRKRIVPTREHGWANDGKDVRAILRGALSEQTFGDLNPEGVGANIASVSYWSAFRK